VYPNSGAKIVTSGDRRGSLRAIARRVLTAQGTHPSYETVRAHLALVALKKRSPECKLLLTEEHKQKRLAFARAHGGADWSGAACHDEKKFFLRRPTKSVWRLPGEVVVMPQVEHPVSVNVWGACGRGGVSPIHIFDENLTAKMLCDILVEDFLSHLPEITGMPVGPWLGFHDDPQYRSCHVQSLLADAGIPNAGSPPSSPELNIIENIWRILSDRIQERNLTDKQSLARAIEEEWEHLPLVLLASPVDSAPRRPVAILEAHRGNTRY